MTKAENTGKFVVKNVETGRQAKVFVTRDATYTDTGSQTQGKAGRGPAKDAGKSAGKQ